MLGDNYNHRHAPNYAMVGDTYNHLLRLTIQWWKMTTTTPVPNYAMVGDNYNHHLCLTIKW